MMSLNLSSEELNSLNQLKELARSLFPNPDLPIVGQNISLYDFDFSREEMFGTCLYSSLITNTGSEPMQKWKTSHGKGGGGEYLFLDPTGTPLQYSQYKEQRGEDWLYYGDVQLLNPVNPGDTFEILCKTFMGDLDPVWWEAEHHRRLVRKGMPPAEFRTSLGVTRDSHWLYKWILPQKAQLLDFTPKPVRIFAYDNRLHLIFHFCTVDEHEEFVHFLQYLLE